MVHSNAGGMMNWCSQAAPIDVSSKGEQVQSREAGQGEEDLMYVPAQPCTYSTVHLFTIPPSLPSPSHPTALVRLPSTAIVASTASSPSLSTPGLGCRVPEY